jgi:hypothetical protein
VVTGLLLVMNAMVLHLVCSVLANTGWRPLEQALGNPKVIQAVLLIGSVVLVFGQWWVIERLTARWFPRRGKESEAAEPPLGDEPPKRR